jgi:hypothetical protein
MVSLPMHQWGGVPHSFNEDYRPPGNRRTPEAIP